MSSTFVHAVGRRLTPDWRGLRRAAAIASVLAAMMLVVLDAAIANVALPTIARSLRVAPAQSVWIITAYQAALVMALLPCAALCRSSPARARPRRRRGRHRHGGQRHAPGHYHR